MAARAQPRRQSGRQLGIDDELHAQALFGGDDDGMAGQMGGIGEAGADIVLHEVREVAQDLVCLRARGKHLQHVGHADAHAANAGPPVALFGPDGDAREEIGHGRRIGETEGKRHLRGKNDITAACVGRRMPPKDAYLSRAGLAEKPQTSIDKTALSRIDLLPPPDYFIFKYCLWGMRAM